MNSHKRVLIVGGVAGGASAAARLRRDRDRLLVQTPEKMRQRFNIDVRTQSEVVAIDPPAKNITIHELTTGREYTESYDAL
ncbi:MAG: CoA-disulfide reductase, partial [Planctomycetota bacterium]